MTNNIKEKRDVFCFAFTDIDECSQSISNLCAFQCVNVPGSYQCSCPPHGYIMSANGHTCKGKPSVNVHYVTSGAKHFIVPLVCDIFDCFFLH